MDDDYYSICTPADDIQGLQVAQEKYQSEYINLLLVSDDCVYFNHLLSTLKRRGISIVDFPVIYDDATAVPFLMANDHSIIVFRNPSPAMAKIIRGVLNTGKISFKGN